MRVWNGGCAVATPSSIPVTDQLLGTKEDETTVGEVMHESICASSPC